MKKLKFAKTKVIALLVIVVMMSGIMPIIPFSNVVYAAPASSVTLDNSELLDGTNPYLVGRCSITDRNTRWNYLYCRI